MSDSCEREMINNQKRIIRELKRIADALEEFNRVHSPKKFQTEPPKPFGVDAGMNIGCPMEED